MAIERTEKRAQTRVGSPVLLETARDGRNGGVEIETREVETHGRGSKARG